MGPSTVSIVLCHSQPGRKYKNQNSVQWGHLLWSIHSASFYITHSLGKNTRIKTMYSGAKYCEAFTQPRSTPLTAWAKIQESKQCTVGPSTMKCSPSLVLHHSQPRRKYENQNNIQWGHLLWNIHPASFYVTHSLGENTRIKTMYSEAIYCETFTQPRSTSLTA